MPSTGAGSSRQRGRGGGSGAEKATAASSKAADRGKRPASKSPVHVSVGGAAFLGLVALGSWHWWHRPVPTVDEAGPVVWARAGHHIDRMLQANVTCGKAFAPSKGVCAAHRLSGGCARFVVDDAVPLDKARELQKMVQWLVDEAWGAGAGPPSVVDLHQGSISYKEKFVDLNALMEFKSIKFTDEQVAAYNEVRKSVRGVVSNLFGVPEVDLLHDLTFFSHINGSKVAKTMHDEYWHKHIDSQQYGTFAYTVLIYLSTAQEDFEGGSFIFEDPKGDRAVQPRFGRLVAFTSEGENPHRVEKVSKGIRITLTAAFTCDAEKAQSIEPFPKKKVEKPDAQEGA